AGCGIRVGECTSSNSFPTAHQTEPIMSAQYYASPRVHDDEALPQLLSEMQRFKADQEQIRQLLEDLAAQRNAVLAPAADGEGNLPYDSSEAAVGRAMLAAERHADAVRQAAAEEARQVAAQANEAAEEVRAQARAEADSTIEAALHEAERM